MVTIVKPTRRPGHCIVLQINQRQLQLRLIETRERNKFRWRGCHYFYRLFQCRVAIDLSDTGDIPIRCSTMQVLWHWSLKVPTVVSGPWGMGLALLISNSPNHCLHFWTLLPARNHSQFNCQGRCWSNYLLMNNVKILLSDKMLHPFQTENATGKLD